MLCMGTACAGLKDTLVLCEVPFNTVRKASCHTYVKGQRAFKPPSSKVIWWCFQREFLAVSVIKVKGTLCLNVHLQV